MAQTIAPRITVDPAVRSGKPVIEGTRVPVDVVVGRLASGMTADEIAAEYDIAVEDVAAALHYAARVLESEEWRVTA